MTIRLAYSRKLAVRTLLTVALGVTVYSCATGYQVPETRPSTAVSTEVSETHPSTATSTEIVKVTSAEITQVTDATLREKAISSLPGDKPEAEGGDGSIEVFDANVGGTHFKLYMYKMSQQAIADSKTIEITNNNTVFELKNQVAVYADFINYTGFVAPVRLVGVSTPEVDENGVPTGVTNNLWYYDPGWNPTLGGVVDTSRPVFGYKSDGTDFIFDPDGLMSPNVQIDGYTPDPLGGLSVTFDRNNFSDIFKVDAIFVRPEISFTPMELSTNPDRPGKCTYEDVTSGRLAWNERQNAKPFGEGTKVGWWSKIPSHDKYTAFYIGPSRMVSFCVLDAPELNSEKKLYQLGFQIHDTDDPTGHFVNIVMDEIDIKYALNKYKNGGSIGIADGGVAYDDREYWIERGRDWVIKLADINTKNGLDEMVLKLKDHGTFPTSSEEVLYAGQIQ